MKINICPSCGRVPKLSNCICYNMDRKRTMVYFPCHHFSAVVFNSSIIADDNKVISAFNDMSSDYFKKPHKHYYEDIFV